MLFLIFYKKIDMQNELIVLKTVYFYMKVKLKSFFDLLKFITNFIKTPNHLQTNSYNLT
jgi:hypothetical protein